MPSKNQVKKWACRTKGIQKKFHQLYWMFGVQVAVYVVKDGELNCYESRLGFFDDKTCLSVQRKVPNDFFYA